MIKEKNFSNLIDVYNDTKNDESTFWTPQHPLEKV